MIMAELMKGKVWGDGKPPAYPLYLERKYDGIRCHARLPQNGGIEYLSYAGKSLHNLGEYSQEMLVLHNETGYREFDFEVLVNGNFADTYRYLRSSTGVPKELKGADVQFILLDFPGSLSEYTYRRQDRLDAAVRAYSKGAVHLETPYERLVHSEAEVVEEFHKALASGHEGLMLKTPQHLYERGKRTAGWLKMKPEEDEDGQIVQINEAISLTGVPLGRAGSVVVHMPDGSTAQPSGIAHGLGKDMWENQEEYIGQWVQFKYMQRDRQGGYRHPIFIRLREEK